MAIALIVAPLLPGKREEYRQFIAEISGPRRAEWDDLQRRLNVERELIWEQRLPGLDLAVLCIDGPTIEEVIEYMSTSERPFDVWFANQIEDLQGFLSEMPEGMELPELIVEWHDADPATAG